MGEGTLPSAVPPGEIESAAYWLIEAQTNPYPVALFDLDEDTYARLEQAARRITSHRNRQLTMILHALQQMAGGRGM